MSDSFNAFPHTRLKFLTSGKAASGNSPRSSPQSKANSGNRDGHGGGLKSSVTSIASSWQSTLETRQAEELPDLPKAISLILEVDPKSFDADTLKSFGIEVILELEDGYILGASADENLTQLQEKISKFVAEEKGGGKVAEIWQILEGQLNRLEYILSPDLLENWDNIVDEQHYTIDVSIACVGINPKFSAFPAEREGRDPAKSAKIIARWSDKRDQTLQEWDDLLCERETDFRDFVSACGGITPQSIFYDDRSHINLLPDSFSCRIEISGKGLKDIALNYSYVFDISEPEQFAQLESTPDKQPDIPPGFILEPPSAAAPKVCVIDSGIQENHPLLKVAVDTENSRSWVPSQKDLTVDNVQDGGHGTRVTGALLYPQGIPKTSKEQSICWIQNARILDNYCRLSEKIRIPDVLTDIVNSYHKRTGTRIFNHSVAGSSPCRTTYMSAWAATIDYLSYQNDILFIVAAGNIPVNRLEGLSHSRRTLEEYHQANKIYPDYLLEPSARIANPAQSFPALTVGSIAHSTYNTGPKRSVAKADHPSAFSCSGYGIWDSIKPDVVEYGGDFAIDSEIEPNFSTPPDICPELVRTTTGGAPAIASDRIGTSFAAPKVAHIAAVLEATFPEASCLLYRALIVQSARLPEWTNDLTDLSAAIRMMGYGLPNLARAIGNADNRITLITQEDQFIKARQAYIYQVGIPPELQSPAENFDIRVEITLSYKAEPRRTRRNKRKYLSTWLHWECNHKGESPDQFLTRVLKDDEYSSDKSLVS